MKNSFKWFFPAILGGCLAHLTSAQHWDFISAYPEFTPPSFKNYLPPTIVVESIKDYEPVWAHGPLRFGSWELVPQAAVDEFAKRVGIDFAKYLGVLRVNPAQFEGQSIHSIHETHFPLYFVAEDDGEEGFKPPVYNHHRPLPASIFTERPDLSPLEDWCVAEVKIDSTGAIKSIHPANRENHDRRTLEDYFESVVESAGGADLFYPAKRNGQPVSSSVRLYWRTPRLPEATALPSTRPQVVAGSRFAFADCGDLKEITSYTARVATDRFGEIQLAYLVADENSDWKASANVLALVSQLSLGANQRLRLDLRVHPGRKQIELQRVEEMAVIPPVRIHTVKPEFPQVNIRGRFVVEFDVGVDGVPRNFKIVESPHKVFNRFLLRALEQWRYQPATFGGQPVRVHNTQTLEFDREWHDHPQPIDIEMLW